MQQLSEHDIIKLLISKPRVVSRIVFVMFGSLVKSRAQKPDYLLAAVEVKREEMGLTPQGIPGDIDLLLIPHAGEQAQFNEAIAIEVKVVRPTLKNPSRNANSLGQRQVNGLVNDGFPYVGLIHVITPEPSPNEEMVDVPLWQMSDPPFNVIEGIQVIGKYILDPRWLTASERQFGRIRKLDLPAWVGRDCFDIARRKEDDEIKTIVGFGIDVGAMPQRNPKMLEGTVALIRSHYQNCGSSYAVIKWPV